MPDLVLRGGRIIDPASGRDETTDIAFGDGKVTEIGRNLAARGAETVDVRGLFVVPGLMDADKRQFELVLCWALDRLSREGMVPTVLHL